MAIYSVAYELNRPQEYTAFYDRLEAYPHTTIMDGYWLIETEDESSAIRDQLMPHICRTDALFVTRLSEDWAGAGTKCTKWLNTPERTLVAVPRSA